MAGFRRRRWTWPWSRALEHKPEYAAKAAEILSAYAEAYPGPHTNAVTGGMIYQSLDEAMWVIPLAQSYDLIHSDLSPEQCVKIESFLRTVAQGLQRCGHQRQLGVVALVGGGGGRLCH